MIRTSKHHRSKSIFKTSLLTFLFLAFLNIQNVNAKSRDLLNSLPISKILNQKFNFNDQYANQDSKSKFNETSGDTTKTKNIKNEGLEFFESYMNSPKYFERLTKEARLYLGDSAAVEQVELLAEQLDAARKQYYKAVKFKILPYDSLQEFYKKSSSYKESDSAEVRGFHDNGLMITGVWEDAPPSTFVEEASHTSDAAGNFLFESTSNYLFHSIYDDNYNDPHVEYFSDPSEVRAKLNAFRLFLKDQKVYDAMTENFTQEHIDTLMNNKDLIIKLYENYPNAFNLINKMSDKWLIFLMNTIALNNQINPKNNQAPHLESLHAQNDRFTPIKGIRSNKTFFWIPSLSANSSSAIKSRSENEIITTNIQSHKTSFTKGGIDFNEKSMNITTIGGEIEFTIPLDLQDIDPTSFDGFVPIIINITPLTNFIGVLDLDKTTNDQNQQFSQSELIEPNQAIKI